KAFGYVDVEWGWWAALTRALISQTRAPSGGDVWHFAQRPGPGCFPCAVLSSHERQTLPLWIDSLRLRAAESPAQPAITVVIPVFNLGRYLPEAIESVLAQTYQDFELFIIDDGSTDEYTQLMLDHLHRPRTRLLRQPNQGVAAARNNG